MAKYKNPLTGKWETLSVAIAYAGGTPSEPVEKETFFPPENILSYIKKEAAEVAEKVRSVQTSDSIVFATLSDGHFYNRQGTSSDGLNTDISNEHAFAAIKTLSYMLDIDFMAHLGDVSWGASDSATSMLKGQIEKGLSYFDEANSNIPCFVAIGNHDSGTYGNEILDGEYLFEHFTELSASENTVFGGEEYGGYCYRDFPGKKFRVFLLNTSEELVKNNTDNATLGSQRKWLANALLELNTKAEAANWGFFILCHYPADYGATMPLSNLLKAYVDGESISITDENGSTENFNFSGRNGAKFICQVHGHIHNFLHGRLHSNSTGSVKEYDGYRFCTSNVQYNRENYYGVFNGINFAEDKAYTKTLNTAKDTSFCVNVFNPSENMIYSFAYGAGYDRAISLEGIKYYSVGKNLTLASITDESATTVAEGGSYSAKVSIAEGYTLKSVVITMGGRDITATAYNESAKQISVASVTGDIVITVVAKAPAVNLLTLAIDTDGSLYNGGKGYKSGYRLSTSDGGDRAQSGMYASGFIPIADGETLLLNNVGRDAAGSSNGYNESYLIRYYALGTASMEGQIILKDVAAQADGSIRIPVEELKLDNGDVCKYIRLSCSYLGDDTTIFVE